MSVERPTRAYSALLLERHDDPCTPEQAAGPDASVAGRCGGHTAHQHAGQCMRPGCGGKAA